MIEPTGQLDGDVAFKIAVSTLAIPKSSLPKPDELTALRAHFARLRPYFLGFDARVIRCRFAFSRNPVSVRLFGQE